MIVGRNSDPVTSTLLGCVAGLGGVAAGLFLLLPRLQQHLAVSTSSQLGMAVLALVGLGFGAAVSTWVLTRAAGDRLSARLPFAGLAAVHAGLFTALAAYVPAVLAPVLVLLAALALGVAAVVPLRLLLRRAGVRAVAPASVVAAVFGAAVVVLGPPFIGATTAFASSRTWNFVLPASDSRLRAACWMAVAAGLMASARLFGLVAHNDLEDPHVGGAEVDVTSPSSALLDVRSINVSYGRVQVLFDVSIEVGEGEAVALLGTNGAGKSTVLRAAFGLVRPTTGRVLFAGQDVSAMPAEQRMRQGMIAVPGGRGVFPSMTVLENLQMAGYHLRDRKRVSEGIDRTLESFPRLEERLRLPAGLLSGGEQQMLALGRAWIAKPRLLAIDELTLGLAPNVVDSLIAFVRELNAGGMAVVIVEQSVHVALEIAHRAYFLERGQVRFSGATEDLLHREDLLRSVFLAGAGAEG